MLEENVVSAAGTSYQMSQNEMIRLIRELGLKPAKRNTNYDILERF
ncbi:MAG: dehypoxanthine futalosine cyclase, partial [Campylobacteraceae bacterium]|nr:dehypoxanthine futalosine cyclase [Campylobacteraceae bacterium]